MAALAYDAGLRREEVCSLRSDDLDPAHRMVRIRAEVAKGSRERVVPYSVTTGELLRAYLAHRRTIAHTRGPLSFGTGPGRAIHARNESDPCLAHIDDSSCFRPGVPFF